MSESFRLEGADSVPVDATNEFIVNDGGTDRVPSVGFECMGEADTLTGDHGLLLFSESPFCSGIANREIHLAGLLIDELNVLGADRDFEKMAGPDGL